MLPTISPASPDVPTIPPSQTCRTSAIPAAPYHPLTPKCSKSPIFFNARVIARQDDGWEDMLERTLLSSAGHLRELKSAATTVDDQSFKRFTHMSIILAITVY